MNESKFNESVKSKNETYDKGFKKINESESNESIKSINEENDKNFDYNDFYVNINNSISKNQANKDDVELSYYLLAYEQLYNFFVLLGGAFQFVAVDVKNKIEILNQLLRDEFKEGKSKKNFSTVKSMVNYEKENNLFEDKKYTSGSRTLLRLHRGLDFFQKFLHKIYKLEKNEKLGRIAREVYDITLAEHHTWVVRNSARVAMQFLPTRKDLLNKITKNDEEKLEGMLKTLPDALKAMKIVFDRVQHIYTENEILNLK